jgi:hypothetical protein
LFLSTTTSTFIELLPSRVLATTRKKIDKDIPALANGERVFIFSLLCIEVIAKYKYSFKSENEDGNVPTMRTTNVVGDATFSQVA